MDITGRLSTCSPSYLGIFHADGMQGAFYANRKNHKYPVVSNNGASDSTNEAFIDTSRAVPVASKNQVDNIALLPFIYYI